MKRNAILLPVLSLFVILSVGTTAAQPGKGRGGAGPDSCWKGTGKYRMFDDLKLTDEQQTKLKALHDEMMTTRKKHGEAVKAVRDKMKTELLKQAPSQKALNGYAGELGKLHEKMTTERTAHLLNVKKILTPEQFSKLVEKEDRMGHGGFRDHKGPGNCMGKGDCPRKGDCPHMRKGGAHGGNCPHMKKVPQTDSTSATK